MVTAVITTYKRGPCVVERALKSILSQTCSPMEVIIVDDSPADYELRADVEKMAAAYNVRYIKHEKNLGACAARNTGLRSASGEYIAFLDDDDEWLPEKIEKQLRVMDNGGDGVALVYCGDYVLNEKTHITKLRKKRFVRGQIFDRLILGNIIGSTSIPLLRTDCLREIGGFDADMPASQDYDVWLRLSERYSADYVAEPLVRYHIHDGECITGDPKKKIEALQRLNGKYSEYLRTHKKALSRRLIRMAPPYAAAGQRGKALGLWLKAVAYDPLKVLDNCKFLILFFLK